MVKTLTEIDYDKINTALKITETKTTAKIRFKVRPSSDHYQEFVLLYGLIFGSLVSLILWTSKIVHSYPWLLVIQLSLTILINILPWVRKLCMHLVPAKILYHKAKRMAFYEYHEHHTPIANDVPFVFLFVSLTEHYVHVITNPTLHKRVPDDWGSVITKFTLSMQKYGLGTAIQEAIECISEQLQSSQI